MRFAFHDTQISIVLLMWKTKQCFWKAKQFEGLNNKLIERNHALKNCNLH